MHLGSSSNRSPLGLIAAALALSMLFVVGGVSAATASGSEPGRVGGQQRGQERRGQDVVHDQGQDRRRRHPGRHLHAAEVQGHGRRHTGQGRHQRGDHRPAGTKSKFTAIRTLEVRKINGQKLSSLAVGSQALQAAACDILNLVLGPLDLNILGLEVHLNQVVLDIIATPGPGQLLGNLLCAVAGLLTAARSPACWASWSAS